MENEEKKLNIKKVLITIFVLIFAFVIIVISALITSGATKKKEQVEVSKSLSKESSQFENEDEQEVEKIDNDNLNKPNTNTVDDSKTNTEVSGKLPVYNPDCVQQVKSIYGSEEKNIYLTFDDGPSPNITPQILEILKEEEVPATFFVLGSRAELYPDLIKQEFNEGHYIANHGYSHSYSTIYASVDSVVDEYNRTETAIQNALGTTEYHSYLFRFPGGSSGGPYDSLKAEAKEYLNSQGIAATNWNCLTGDAEGGKRTVEQLTSRLYESAEGWDSLIVLMHDADDKQTTADALPEIIQHYKKEGYTFKNFYEIYK